MGAFDISRNAFFPAKHYSGVRMQQGRVLTDDDWNEQSRIHAEAQRRALTEIVGPFGSPDRGFKITNLVVAAGHANFDIEPGTMYLGGLRLEMDRPSGMGGALETLHTQRDWLQHLMTSYPVPNAASLTSPRYDLVYLEAWEQGVSAVEDNELFETALAGPDTTTRMRLMRRVKVATSTPSPDCLQSWQYFKNTLISSNRGQINAQMERIVNTRLQVGFTETGSGDDLCTPAVAGRYLGAENQAIRVQLLDDTHFTWGFDNASPYYRVRKVNANTVELMDLPKDQHHWPLTGENVELLPWSAILPNGQKVAETAGHLSKITGSYDPNTHRITLASPLPPNFNTAWQGRPDASSISPGNDINPFYMRVWHRGSDTLSPVGITILPGGNVLGNTGLVVTITGTDRVPGDYWIIAVRPETPDVIMPWRLEHTGMAPHGVRTFFAPLAIIRWQRSPGDVLQGEVIHDCRKTFRPLTDLETCCTFHVGDGMRTFGDFDSIEEAVANLPLTGGKICVLPGDHRCNLRLDARSNITICGCGEQSRIRPHEARVGEPIFAIANCSSIKIESLAFFARQDRAILLLDQVAGQPSNRIKISHNSFLAVRNAIYVLTNSFAAGDNAIEIAYNDVAIPDIQGAGVGIFSLADGVNIHHNRVMVVPAPEQLPTGSVGTETNPNGTPSIGNPCNENANHDQQLMVYWVSIGLYVSGGVDSYQPLAFLALGGIQVAGTSERVSVTDNRVKGGAASGIILGHLPSMLEENRIPSSVDARWDEINRIALSTGLLLLSTLSDEERRLIERSLRPHLYDIDVQRNQVCDMGMAGIGVMCFVIDQDGEPSSKLVTVENFWANENRIMRCARQIPAETPDSIMIGYGGIVLAQLEDGTLTDNEVRDCGRSNIEPVCGIYIRSGNIFNISGNRIFNNGPEPVVNFGEVIFTSTQVRKGSRGGIFIALALKNEIADLLKGDLLPDGRPAAMIHDNTVVQPLGQALFMIGLGPVSVNGNYFVTQDQDATNATTLLASTVFVMNLGISKDVMRLMLEPAFIDLASSTPQEFYAASLQSNENDLLALNLLYAFLQFMPSGQVLFNDNQVIFDQRDLLLDFSLCATAIVALDDVSFVSNQLECLGLQMVTGSESTPTVGLDYMLTDAFVISASLRTATNRFQEGFTATAFSLISLALWNSTIGNISTNCLLAFGTREVFEHNIESTIGFVPNEDRCDSVRKTLKSVLFRKKNEEEEEEGLKV
jgi:Family of unknown function (DUF6519)